MRATQGNCRKCRTELGDSHSEITENNELVIVDKMTKIPQLLRKGDRLCLDCGKFGATDYYRRIRL